MSTDGGKTWSFHDIELPSGDYPARYGAFPSETTWYVGSGSWSDAPVKNKVSPLSRNMTSLDVNSRVTVSREGTRYRHDKVESDYHWGAISKTTDGGRTFEKVFESRDYYMNEIDCSATEICMAVGENGDSAVVLRTEDGGKSWATVMSVTSLLGENLMGCKMLSDTEAWVSGGTFDGGMVGHYYHTMDGGKTWDMQSLKNGYSMDLSFSDGTGCSPAMREHSSSVAMLK